MARRLLLALLGLAALVSGCVEQDETFTEGRIQTTCDGTTPICDQRATCVIDDDTYVESTFPGGLKAIVRTDTGDNQLIVRFLLREMISPGTELLVRAYHPGCGNSNERHLRDVDLFERAGDDRILEYRIDLPGKGDHLLEIFSDMTADYTLTTTVEDK